MRTLRDNSSAKFVSFSGIDGAGKSTQIDSLRKSLQDEGRQVSVITFWDNIARLVGFRETAGHRIFKGEKGIGTPAAPVNRRDKNVQSWFMTLVRLCLYLMDAISTRHVVKKILHSGVDLVIFDRYIYDELANLPLHNPAIKAYVRLLMKLIPRPHVSYLLDADPIQARARKPEYPLEFLYTNRRSYLDLAALVGGITLIAPKPINEVKRDVLARALREFSSLQIADGKDIASRSNGPESILLDGPQTRPAVL